MYPQPTPQRRYAIQETIPYAAAVPGTDMGEQQGGTAYWAGHAWVYSGEYLTFTQEGADRELARLRAGRPYSTAAIFDAYDRMMLCRAMGVAREAAAEESEDMDRPSRRAYILAAMERVREHWVPV
ncbi:hypothetical protein ACU4GI_32980 [Cupriavidus basilensis]